MDEELLTGVDWLVATLSPWVVGPHPNFPVERPTPRERVALAADGRFVELQRARDKAQPIESEPSFSRVADSILDSLLDETQEEGADRLAGYVRQGNLSPGVVATCALFAAVAYSELDRLDESLQVVEDALRRVEADQDTRREYFGTVALIRSVLSQQRVMRLIELDRDEEAFELAVGTERALPGGKDAYESFTTSRAINYSARQAQLDIVAGVRSHAVSAQAMLEGFRGKTWIKSVRRRAPYVERRPDLNLVRSLDALVRREFDREASSLVGRRRFAAGDQVDGPVATSLLHSELMGDAGGTRHARQLLGRLRTLSVEDRMWSLREGLRLLRQSGSREPLEDALQLARAEGPLEALLADAERILDYRAPHARITRNDVLVLAAAAEVLEPASLARAIEAVQKYEERPAGRLLRESSAGWVPTEVSWRALSRLVPGSGEDNNIAHSLVESVKGREIERHLYSPLAALVASLDWSQVAEDVSSDLVHWVAARASSEGYGIDSLILDQVRGVSRHDDLLRRPEGLELGARILFEHRHGFLCSEQEVRQAVDACLVRMRSIRESAAKGSSGFGGISATEVAAGLIFTFERVDLWQPLVELIADPKVRHHDKAEALDRLALETPRMPDDVKVLLTPRSVGLFDRAPADPFDTDAPPASGPALRFLATYGLLDDQSALDAFSRLAGGGPGSQAEAARSASFLSGIDGQVPVWAVGILMQLSAASGAIARAEAGRSLAAMHRQLTQLEPLLTSRLEELLSEPGFLVPLLVLSGLSSVDNVNPVLWEALRPLAQSHPARSVRNLATRVEP